MSAATRPEVTLAVIVPTWNEEGRLPLLLESLGCRRHGSGPQESTPDEVLVVDGGSQDRTRDVADGYGVRVVAAPRGRGVQLALGARETGAEILLFLHADTRVGVGAIDAIRGCYRRSDLIASGMRQRIEHPGRFYRWVEGAANARVRRGTVYGDSGLAVRRRAYDAVGGFTDQPLFEDLDLSRRLRREGPVRLIEEAELFLSPRRWEREGALRRTFKNWALTAAWWAGVDPHRLMRYYAPDSGAGE